MNSLYNKNNTNNTALCLQIIYSRIIAHRAFLFQKNKITNYDKEKNCNPDGQ